MYWVFATLTLVSLSQLFKWPEYLDQSPLSLFGGVLANAVFNTGYDKNMYWMRIPGYIVVTASMNYTASLILEKISPIRVVMFILLLLAVSAAVSLAAASDSFRA
jgi:hypothetical protein